MNTAFKDDLRPYIASIGIDMYQHPEACRQLGLRWLYLDLNSYFASVEQQLNPFLRHRPEAVVPKLVNEKEYDLMPSSFFFSY